MIRGKHRQSRQLLVSPMYRLVVVVWAGRALLGYSCPKIVAAAEAVKIADRMSETLERTAGLRAATALMRNLAASFAGPKDQSGLALVSA